MAEDAARSRRRSPVGDLAGYLPRTVTGWLGLCFVGLIIFWLGANLVNDPSEFFNVGIIGLTNGAVYALVAAATRSSTESTG